jgi:hypothetical protein
MRGRTGYERTVTGRWSRVVAAAAAVMVLGACTPPPDDGFSDPPEAPAAPQPGDVLRSRPWSFTQDAVNRTPAGGVRVEQVLYRSTDALGDPVAVTGTVLVPESAWAGPGPRPLVSYAVGTRGIGDDCAPSKSLAQGIDYEGGLIVKLLERGWAVAVSDMEGLGTPGDHTYNVGRSQGRAVLDMARAALRLPGAGLAPDSPVGIVGYSQGGGSAGWAAQLADTYAPELRLAGVVAGGVPADLLAVAEQGDGGPFVALVLLTSIGFDEAYPELRLDSYVNERGRALLDAGRRFCLLSLDGLTTFLGVANTWTDDYVTSVNPLRTQAWQARLDENRLGGWAPTVPVLMHHGLFDQMVPFAQAERLRGDWCAQGAPLSWRVFPLAEHVIGGLLHGDPAMAFLHDRFAGRPFTSNCADPFPL